MRLIELCIMYMFLGYAYGVPFFSWFSKAADVAQPAAASFRSLHTTSEIVEEGSQIGKQVVEKGDKWKKVAKNSAVVAGGGALGYLVGKKARGDDHDSKTFSEDEFYANEINTASIEDEVSGHALDSEVSALEADLAL
jgi:hypothetical protein